MKIKNEIQKMSLDTSGKDRIYNLIQQKIANDSVCDEEYTLIAEDATNKTNVIERNIEKHNFRKTILKVVCANCAALIILISIFGFNLGNIQNTFSNYVPKFIECYLSGSKTIKSFSRENTVNTFNSPKDTTLDLVILVENKQKDSILLVSVFDSELNSEVEFTPNSEKFQIKSMEMQKDKEKNAYITTIILGIPASKTPRTLDIREIKYFRKRMIGKDLYGSVTIPDKNKAQVIITVSKASDLLKDIDCCHSE